MEDVGGILFNFFGPLGPAWGLVFIFILFYVDAIVFPTLPELFVVLIFMGYEAQSTGFLIGYGVAMLLIIAVAEVAGLLTLYLVVTKAKLGRFRPKITSVVMNYRRFLVIQDERMILVNRLAPILPYMGAFVALSGWDLRRSIFYVILGGMIKYGIILTMSGYFFKVFSQGTAQTATIALVIAIILISLVVSLIRRRRVESADRAT